MPHDEGLVRLYYRKSWVVVLGCLVALVATLLILAQVSEGFDPFLMGHLISLSFIAASCVWVALCPVGYYDPASNSVTFVGLFNSRANRFPREAGQGRLAAANGRIVLVRPTGRERTLILQILIADQGFIPMHNAVRRFPDADVTPKAPLRPELFSKRRKAIGISLLAVFVSMQIGILAAGIISVVAEDRRADLVEAVATDLCSSADWNSRLSASDDLRLIRTEAGVNRWDPDRLFRCTLELEWEPEQGQEIDLRVAFHSERFDGSESSEDPQCFHAADLPNAYQEVYLADGDGLCRAADGFEAVFIAGGRANALEMRASGSLDAEQTETLEDLFRSRILPPFATYPFELVLT